jgi:molybdate transport system regulatory protein
VGKKLVKHYRAVESSARIAAAVNITALIRLLAP